MLGAAADLARIANQTITIGTEQAVQRLDSIQIGEMLAVENNVIGPPNPGDSINPETDRLVEPNLEIDQQQRDDQRVNDGGGHGRAEARFRQKA